HCTLDSSTFRGVTSHGNALEVAYDLVGVCSDRSSGWSFHELSFVAVGVGPSKQPSTTPAVLVEMTETSGKKKTMDWARKVTWGKDGSLDIAITRSTGSTQAPSMDDAKDIKGHHVLAFP